MAFFFACVFYGQKKVGVLADLVLVSTCKGDARVGEATSERLEMTPEQILGAFHLGRCDQLHSSLSTKEKGADWRP